MAGLAGAVLGAIPIVSATGSAGAASSQTRGPGVLSARQFQSATLPAGVCPTGRIKLSNGNGHSGYWNAWTIGARQHVNFGAGHAGLAATVVCSQGGSFESRAVWVFNGPPGKLRIVAGPIYARSYNVGDLGVNGPAIANLHVAGHTLVVNEEFQGPDVCGGSMCAPEKTTTTWTWSNADPSRLMIKVPSAIKAVVTVRVTPAGLNGQPLTGRLAQRALHPGQSIRAVCTTSQLPATHFVELVSGAWLPDTDLRPITLPDCDAGATQTPPSSVSPAVAPTTTPTTTATTSTTTTVPPTPTSTSTTAPATGAAAPCTVEAITAAAQAHTSDFDGVDSGGYGCSGNFAYAFVTVGTPPDADVTILFMSVNGAWQPASRAVYCENGSVPQAIYQNACQTQ